MALVAQLCPNIAQVLALSRSIGLSTFHKLGKKSKHMEMIFAHMGRSVEISDGQIHRGYALNNHKRNSQSDFTTNDQKIAQSNSPVTRSSKAILPYCGFIIEFHLSKADILHHSTI